MVTSVIFGLKRNRRAEDRAMSVLLLMPKLVSKRRSSRNRKVPLSACKPVNKKNHGTG